MRHVSSGEKSFRTPAAYDALIADYFSKVEDNSAVTVQSPSA